MVKDILKEGEMQGGREMSSVFLAREGESLSYDDDSGIVNEGTDIRKCTLMERYLAGFDNGLNGTSKREKGSKYSSRFLIMLR